MSWDNKGTFKYKNKLIPKSNILHLVTHALLKDVKDKPPGMKQFYEGLSDVNVPEYLVANKIGNLIIEGRGDELTLKTPTHLVKKKKKCRIGSVVDGKFLKQKLCIFHKL